MPEIDDFIALSLLLTGEAHLERPLAEQYLNRITSGPLGASLPPLLTTFRVLQSAGGDINAAISTQILADAVLGPLAKQILILWYTGILTDADGKNGSYGSPEQFFSGLVWPTIGAHPPGLSGGYFGYWRYAPEN